MDVKRPNFPNDGLRLLHTADGRYQLESHYTFAASRAVASGDTLGPGAAWPKKVAMKLRVDWGHASSRRMKRVLGDAGGNSHDLL